MTILIIGGTGFISGRLTEMLLAEGHLVTTMSRGVSGASVRGAERLFADRRNARTFADAIGTRTFDAVFDMVAYTPEESRTAMQVLRGKVGRFIHCSTVSVYMVSNDVRCPITEDQDHAPLMPFFARNPFGMDYGILKRQCEDVLWNQHHPEHVPVTMLRPSYVCGPGDPARRDWFWIERILDGGPLLVPGSGNDQFQSVFVDDVARCFVSTLHSLSSVGRSYNVAGAEIFTLNEYLFRLGSLLGRTPQLVHVPQETFDQLKFSTSPDGDVFPFNVRRQAVFSLERSMNDLDFQPTPFDTWMPSVINWFKRPGTKHSAGYSYRQEELKHIEQRMISAGAWEEVQ
jgi:dTDP-glucose 4,6-dehydratase